YAADGRGEETLLLNLILNHFQVNSTRQLIDRIYQAPVPKNEISPVAKLVIKAYKQNDSVAKHIIGEAADDMVTGILALSNKLFSKSVSVPVVLCGGVFHDKTVLPVMMREK